MHATSHRHNLSQPKNHSPETRECVGLSCNRGLWIVLVALVALCTFPIDSALNAQTTIYSQDFEAYSDGYSGSGDGWTTSIGGQTDYFEVKSRSGSLVFEGNDTDAEVVWTSTDIDVSGHTNLELAIYVFEDGNAESADYVHVTYVLDGVESATNLSESNDDFTEANLSGLSIQDGATLNIRVKLKNNANTEQHGFDNIVLTGTVSCTPATWYIDADGDGLGDAGTAQSSCDQPAGYVANSTDNCDDLTACNYDDVGNGACTYPGCTNASACNYDSAAGCDDSSCVYASGCDSCSGATDGTGTVVDGDSDDDGICDASDLCSNLSACNYDGSLYTNASCIIPSGCQTCSGGVATGASNEVFTVNITFDGYPTETSWSLVNGSAVEVWSLGPFTSSEANGSYSYSSSCLPTTGTYTFTMEDSYGDGLCYQGACGSYDLVVGDSTFTGNVSFTTSTSIEVEFGCTDSGASNYSATADVDNGTCTFPGCTNASACNYDAAATSDDGSCVYASGCDTCSGATDGSGTVVDGDSDDDGICDGSDLCSNLSACNYDGSLYANGACDVPGACDTCSGGAVVDGDSDDDGICDGSDLCSNTSACNYDGSIYTNEACDVPGACDTCSGGAVVDGDSDDDGICDGSDLCSNLSACNYDGSLYTNEACDVPGACDTCSGGAVVDGDSDDDGICDASDLCSNTSACNYDGSLYTNEACDVPGACDTCSGGAVVDGDSDDDGICDASDLCSNTSACNYDGSLYTNEACDVPGACDTCSGGAVVDGDTDGDGICNGSDLCSDLSACNYDGSSSNVSCLYNDALGVCGGDCVADSNANGICDTEECIDAANPVAATNDTTLYLDASGNATVTAAGIDNGSSDDCVVASLSLDITAFDCTDIGTPVTVTLTVTDGDGNTNTATATVTVLDNSAPTSLSASGTTVNLSSGSVTLSPSDLLASATDNCTASPTYELSKDDSNWSSTLSYTCSDLGSNTVYVRAVDGSSNASASTSVSVTVADNTAPTISSVTAGITEVLSGAGAATIDPTSYVTASDDCTGSGALTYEISETSGSGFATTFAADCADIGAKTFYFRVTDASGNVSAESSVSITIADQTAPTIASVSGATVNLDGNGDATITASSTYVTSTDNCTASGSLTYLVCRTVDGTYASSVAVDCNDLGSLDLYFKTQDASGNTSAASSAASFTIADVTGPTASASNATVSLDANGDYTLLPLTLAVSATDNCESSMTFELSKNDVDWSSTLAYTCTDLGANTVYVRASDGTNSGASSSVTLTIEDNTAPVLTRSDATVNLDASGSYTLTPSDISASASDNCEASPTIELSHNNSTWASTLSFDCDSIGARTVYVRASDGTNVTASGTATVTVQDATGPTFDAPSGSYALSAGSVQVFFYQATGSSLADNCDANGSITKQASKTGTDWATAGASVTYDCSEAGEQTIYVRATDSYGNVTTTSGTITITESAPTISSVLSGQTEALGSDGTVTIDASAYITATDDCSSEGSMTYEISETSGSGFATTFVAECADIGAKTFYFRVTDENANVSAESSTSITIADQTAPVGSASANTIYLDAAGAATLVPDSFFTATDNCTTAGALTLEMTPAGETNWATSIAVDCSNLGSASYNFRATDGAGNVTSTEYTALVTVADHIDPVAVANNITLNLVGATVSLSASNATFNTSTDNCGIATSTITVNGTTGSSYDFNMLGLYTVTLTVTDAQGNVATNTASVTVTSAPTVLYSEDFEDASLLSAGDMCGTGTVAAANGNFSALCEASDFIGVVSYAGSQQFTWEDSENAGWLSPVIDISGYIVDFSADVSEETNIDVSDYLTLYISIDGGSYVMYDQRNRCACTHTPFGETGFMGSTMQVLVTGGNDQNENWYLDNVVIQGCVDQDGDGICDPVDSCVDFPAGSCGCTDQTACNYDSAATKDDGSCNHIGMQCAAPSGTTGYVYTPDLAGTGCDCSSTTMTQLYFEGFDDEINQNESAQYTSICPDNGYAANGSNWTLSCGNGTGVFGFPSSQSGADLCLNVYQASDAVLTTADIDVTSYVNAFASAAVEPNYSGPNLEATDGWTMSILEDGADAGVLASLYNDVVTETVISGDVDVTSVSTLAVVVEGDAPDAAEDIYLDDITVYGYGKVGCANAEATNYDASSTYVDSSCTFTTAFSRYDGGFSDKIWGGSTCNGDCGSGPYLDAVFVKAQEQTSLTQFNYTISSGTTITVDGTATASDDPMIEELFVRDLTIKSGGALVIPSGKRLRVMGTFQDFNAAGISGGGQLCIDGTFTVPEGEGTPTTVNVGDFMVVADGTLTIPAGKTVQVNGDLSFGSDDPLSVTGKLAMGADTSTVAQTISGDGAVLDELVIANPAGVTVNDSLEIRGRLTLDPGVTLAMGPNWLTFASKAGATTGSDKTALLDPIPATATFSGFNGGRSTANQSQSSAVRAVVQRFVAPDDDGTTFVGQTLYGTPISGAVVSDLNNIEGFYSAGWPGSDYPNSMSTVFLWDEINGMMEAPESENESLTDRGCWITLLGSQTPVMETSGALNNHQIDGADKVFTVTRQGPVAAYEGWNLVFNPYQAQLDWNSVIATNSDVIEDQFAVYDTQLKRFRRYGVSTAGVNWANEQESGADSTVMRYINPGQAFWVRVKENISSTSLTLRPSMIDNDGSAVGFIRSIESGVSEVLIEVENAYGANRTFLRFSDHGDSGEYIDGDMSFMTSSSIKSGEAAFIVGEQKYVSKNLPLEAFDGIMHVESRANWPTTMRVVEAHGEMPVCAHIVDNVTGEVLVLQEGEEINFTLSTHEAEEGRFTLHSVPLGLAEGFAPECPDSEEGLIVMELGDAVADLTVVDYNSLEVVLNLFQETGTIEMPLAPGVYSINVNADEESSYCRGGRRMVEVAPGEQPELLGVEPFASECNEGLASLGFELYGAGTFATSLMQGNEAVWESDLEPGEHLLTDLAPGDYVLKVDHACLQDFEWVSLWDGDMPSIVLEAPGFVQAEAVGGAWIEAQCAGCTVGENQGYTWYLDGEEVGEDEPLAVRVESVGTYTLEVMTYGFSCDANASGEVVVGKYLTSMAGELQWLGVSNGQMGMVFSEEWRDVRYRWFDATGRLIDEGRIPSGIGEVFIDAPGARGWLSLKLTGSEGQQAIWSGIH